MAATLTDVSAWLETPLGQELHSMEASLLASTLSHVFGLQLVQVGAWGPPGRLLADARTSRSMLVDAQNGPGVALRCDPASLPIAPGSVDAVLLPHTLELHAEPHKVLREAGRALAGEGHLITLGFNPFGLWGLRRATSRRGFPAGIRRFISERRLRDWLALLGFEVLRVERYCYRLPLSRALADSGPKMEVTGARFWPALSGAYLMLAKKRVYTMTPIRPVWTRKRGVVGGLVEPTTRNGVHREEGA